MNGYATGMRTGHAVQSNHQGIMLSIADLHATHFTYKLNLQHNRANNGVYFTFSPPLRI